MGADNKVEDMIVVQMASFLLYQEITVYKDNKIVEKTKSTFDGVEDNLIALVNKYGIKKIHLKSGNPFFNVRLKEKLMTKYAENPIEVIIH